jgi:hypothetical protein
MYYKDIEDNKILDLLHDAIIKQTVSVDHDSKTLIEMNNALNWLLTLMTVLLAYYMAEYAKPAINCLDYIIFIISKILFIVSIISLIVHKISLISYEKNKYVYISSLATLELEFKYDVAMFRRLLNENDRLFIPDFINNFRNGVYLPYPQLDTRTSDFKKIDRRLTGLGATLKFTFWLVIVCFTLYFAGIVYLLYR